jgi:hypothetical protein
VQLRQYLYFGTSKASQLRTILRTGKLLGVDPRHEDGEAHGLECLLCCEHARRQHLAQKKNSVKKMTKKIPLLLQSFAAAAPSIDQ